MLGAMVTSPLEVVKTRLQAKANKDACASLLRLSFSFSFPCPFSIPFLFSFLIGSISFSASYPSSSPPVSLSPRDASARVPLAPSSPPFALPSLPPLPLLNSSAPWPSRRASEDSTAVSWPTSWASFPHGPPSSSPLSSSYQLFFFLSSILSFIFLLERSTSSSTAMPRRSSGPTSQPLTIGPFPWSLLPLQVLISSHPSLPPLPSLNPHSLVSRFFPSAFSLSSGATVVTVTSPLWTVKTRLQLQVSAQKETVISSPIVPISFPPYLLPPHVPLFTNPLFSSTTVSSMLSSRSIARRASRPCTRAWELPTSVLLLLLSYLLFLFSSSDTLIF